MGCFLFVWLRTQNRKKLFNIVHYVLRRRNCMKPYSMSRVLGDIHLLIIVFNPKKLNKFFAGYNLPGHILSTISYFMILTGNKFEKVSKVALASVNCVYLISFLIFKFILNTLTFFKCPSLLTLHLPISFPKRGYKAFRMYIVEMMLTDQLIN